MKAYGKSKGNLRAYCLEERRRGAHLPSLEPVGG